MRTLLSSPFGTRACSRLAAYLPSANYRLAPTIAEGEPVTERVVSAGPLAAHDRAS